jgi:hypothetical protein
MNDHQSTTTQSYIFDVIKTFINDLRDKVKINDYATRGQFDDGVVLGQRGAQLEAFRTQVSQLQAHTLSMPTQPLIVQ